MLPIKSRSMDINDHHNLYSGRCFIVASGPSLLAMRRESLARLNNEYTLAISSLMRWKDIPFIPTFYMSQEIRFWWFYKNLLDRLDYPGLRLHANQNSKELPEPWVLIHDDPGKQIDKGIFYGLSGDRLDRVAGHGGSAVLIATQVLVFMGFKEIYLLGCDGTDKGYVWDTGVMRNKEDTELFHLCSSIACDILDMHGIKFINLTPGGLLPIPCKSLKEVLNAA